jgi:hypothetical protein
MSHKLIFNEDFFTGPTTLQPMEKGKPRSVFEALEIMPNEQWEKMCNHLFPKVHYECIDIEDVVDRIRATDTCSSLDSPVEVWVEGEGDFRIHVYDED